MTFESSIFSLTAASMGTLAVELHKPLFSDKSYVSQASHLNQLHLKPTKCKREVVYTDMNGTTLFFRDFRCYWRQGSNMSGRTRHQKQFYEWRTSKCTAGKDQRLHNGVIPDAETAAAHLGSIKSSPCSAWPTSSWLMGVEFDLALTLDASAAKHLWSL